MVKSHFTLGVIKGGHLVAATRPQHEQSPVSTKPTRLVWDHVWEGGNSWISVYERAVLCKGHLSVMGPIQPNGTRAFSPVNDFEQRSTGKVKLSLVLFLWEWENNQPSSVLSWHLLAFRRDVHLSSSLINNYSVCGPPDRPCILMAARVEAKRREKRGSRGTEWNGRRWSGVKGECKMGSVSCIFWLKAQDAAPKQQIQASRPVDSCSWWSISRSTWGRTLVHKIANPIILRMCWLVSSTKARFNAAECWWQMENSCRERPLELFSPLLS